MMVRLTTYLDYKNQLKALKKTKTLIKNLTKFEFALSNSKELIVLNSCLIPGVDEFLRVAV